MQAAARPYVLATAALVATGLVAGTTPLAARKLQPPVRSIETRLVDSESLLNIPINLFDDIVNIPYNEVEALNTGAASLMDTGTWWVPSATNIWGIDPGDITHVAGILGFIPFPTLTEGVGGLDYQLDGLLAAEIPVSASCDAATCAPITPADVITGNTGLDQNIGFLEALTGQTPFGLFDNFFQVPLTDLTSGYTFTEASDPGVIDPSGPVSQQFGFPLDGGSAPNPFEGGTGLNAAGDNTMPWDGITYTLNPLQPFTNFFDSLQATPSGGLGDTGIFLPTGTEFTQALQNITAGLVIDFDPFTAGSAACPAACDIPASLQIPAIVQSIENLDSSNTTLSTWLADYAAGTAAEPTSSQIDEATALLQTGALNLTSEQLATYDAELASINPELPALLTNAGILTDPGYLAFTDATASTTTGANLPPDVDPLAPIYGGKDISLVPQDLMALLTSNDTNLNALSDFGSALPGAVSADVADPSSAGTMGSDAANLSALLGLGGASSLSTDFSALLAQLSAELSTAMSADLGTNLSTELATMMPTALLGMF